MGKSSFNMLTKAQVKRRVVNKPPVMGERSINMLCNTSSKNGKERGRVPKMITNSQMITGWNQNQLKRKNITRFEYSLVDKVVGQGGS